MVFLIILAASFILSTPCKTVEYYVIPTSSRNTTCPSDHCQHLDNYAQNSSMLSDQQNVSLLFLEGYHYTLQRLHIRNVYQVLLIPYDTSNGMTDTRWSPQIRVQAILENVTHLEIRNLSLEGYLEIFATRATFSWVFLRSTNLYLTAVVIEIKNGFFRHSTISPCARGSSDMEMSLLFESTTLYHTNITKSQLTQYCKTVCIKFIKCSVVATESRIQFLKISLSGNEVVTIGFYDSHIVGETFITMLDKGNTLYVSAYRSRLFALKTNFKLLFASGSNNTIDMFLDSVEVGTNNTKFMEVYHSMSTTFNYALNLTVVNSSFSSLNRWLSLSIPAGYRNFAALNTHYTININSTLFKNNFQCIYVSTSPDLNLDITVNINNSIFTLNKNVLHIEQDILSYGGSALEKSSIFRYIKLTFSNTLFINNKQDDRGIAGVIEVAEVNHLIITDCQFISNTGTAIAAMSSNIVFGGKTTFQNNSGVKGGAIALYQSTVYLLNKKSTLLFFNNRAHDVGGAIFVQNAPSQSYRCFLKSVNQLPLRSANLTFISNSAMRGGDNIYGATLHSSCSFSNTRSLAFSFRIVAYNSSLSSVTSNPKRVCLCDEQGSPQCAVMEYMYRQLTPRYPGEVFTLPAVVVGYDFGTVPGVVYASMFKNSNILEDQHIQAIRIHQKCSQINFSVQSSNVEEMHIIKLNVDGNTVQEVGRVALQKLITKYERLGNLVIDDVLLTHPVILQVPLEECPTGFQLTNSPPYTCTCHHKLEENGITVCVIANHTGWVYRSGTLWVSSTVKENETNRSLVIHQYCPYDYCKPDNISVDLTSPDTQCAFYHSGVLCGGCYGNLSLALGSSKCIACDNSRVSLLVVFIVSGLVLVFFVKILDLTVSKGTINGLIFYANIVWANKSILFTTAEILHPILQILHTFIAWLNLDLGIETCFINGLNGYWKTWLQFVFPLYIWSIAGAIIIASRYSTKASKIFGNNSVPVLATLIFLSYTKLLRTIITSLGFSVLKYPEGPRVVWSFDGNVPYFGAAHTILFLVAIAALLLLWLPYTTVLLTLQWLRRKSYLKPLRWINRWKPFFDAYFGQLKPKHHYWVGLLLLVRVLLLVVFASTSAVIPRINILAIVFTGMALLVHCAVCGLVYKTVSLSILELSFIINLTVLAILKLYIQSNTIADTAVVYTSIAVAFTQFTAIIIHHVYVRVKSTYVTYKRRHTARTTGTSTELRVVPPVAHNHMQYREPLLESSGQSS